MIKESKMICNICRQEVKVRKANPYGAFPIAHVNNESKEPCHGFFEEGFKVQNGK